MEPAAAAGELAAGSPDLPRRPASGELAGERLLMTAVLAVVVVVVVAAAAVVMLPGEARRSCAEARSCAIASLMDIPGGGDAGRGSVVARAAPALVFTRFRGETGLDCAEPFCGRSSAG
jgi:hypothetical protein